MHPFWASAGMLAFSTPVRKIRVERTSQRGPPPPAGARRDGSPAESRRYARAKHVGARTGSSAGFQPVTGGAGFQPARRAIHEPIADRTQDSHTTRVAHGRDGDKSKGKKDERRTTRCKEAHTDHRMLRVRANPQGEPMDALGRRSGRTTQPHVLSGVLRAGNPANLLRPKEECFRASGVVTRKPHHSERRCRAGNEGC